MDVFRLMNWLNDNRKKIVIFSHVTMIITLINLCVSVFTERFAMYPTLFVGSFILQIIVFVMIQTQFKGDG